MAAVYYRVGRALPTKLFTKHQAFSRLRARAAGQPHNVANGRTSRVVRGTGAATGVLCLLQLASQAHCAEGTEETKSDAPVEVPAPSKTPAGDGDAAALFDFKDLGIQLGVGGLAGYSSGYAMKKVGKAAALLAGVGFIGLQVLRYYGIVGDIHWDKVNDHIVKTLDTDKDGKVTAKDLNVHFQRLIKALSFGLPSSAAFATAFVVGVKQG